MQGRDRASDIVTEAAMERFGQLLGIDVAWRGRMLVLKDTDKTVAHRLATQTPLDLAVEHVQECVTRGVAQRKHLISDRHRRRHAPGSPGRRPLQHTTRYRVGEIETLAVHRDTIFQRERPGIQQFAVGEFQTNRLLWTAIGSEELDPLRARVPGLGRCFLQPAVVPVSHLVVCPQRHAQTLAFLVNKNQHVPPFGTE